MDGILAGSVCRHDHGEQDLPFPSGTGCPFRVAGIGHGVGQLPQNQGGVADDRQADVQLIRSLGGVDVYPNDGKGSEQGLPLHGTAGSGINDKGQVAMGQRRAEDGARDAAMPRPSVCRSETATPGRRCG